MLNAVREAQKGRKASCGPCRDLQRGQRMHFNCGGFASAGFVGTIVLKPLKGSSVNAKAEKNPTISTSIFTKRGSVGKRGQLLRLIPGGREEGTSVHGGEKQTCGFNFPSEVIAEV